MDEKLGKSTIVLNGKLKEIQTRSVSVSTEDLHKHVMTSHSHNHQINPGQYNPPFSYIIPYYFGHMPFYPCCPCQFQYLTMWQSYILNESRKNDFCCMYMQQNYMNNHYFNHINSGNNPMICSCPSKQSCDFSKLEIQKQSVENFKEADANSTEKDNQDISICSPTHSRRNVSISTSEKTSISRIPKLNNSNFNVTSTSNDENMLSPKELAEYTNHFLHFPNYEKREENFGSEEDPAGKCS